MKKKKGIMIAAVKSGSGKTTITCALLQLLKEQGFDLQDYKCGPDYIDPMFHERVLGIPSRNLDTFFSDEEQIRELYLQENERTERSEGSLAVLEGVMGLFDGLGGIREEGSTYHLAEILQIPILLVLDGHGMGRSMIPLLSGFLQYDRSHLIQGVILNRTGRGFADTIAPVIEKELGLPVVGCFPEQKKDVFTSRHLGLVMPEEIPDIRQHLMELARQMAQTVDVEQIIQIADKSEFRMEEKEKSRQRFPSFAPRTEEKLRLGVAQDAAFCFYYQDNLRLLKEAGMELIPFSPIHDSRLPENLDGLLLGGGYPELFAVDLEENAGMRTAILEALRGGMPSLAECGGFMYLHEQMVDKEGTPHEMVGAVSGSCKDRGRLVRFGYVTLQEEIPTFLRKGAGIRGHEFHYYDSTNPGADCEAMKPVGGRNWKCVHRGENHWWGFPHLYYPSNPEFVSYFSGEMRRYKNIRTQGTPIITHPSNTQNKEEADGTFAPFFCK